MVLGPYNYSALPIEMIHCKYSKSLKGKINKTKKQNRFNGVPEEEICKKTLPDLLTLGLEIVIIGINPGLTSAYKGHHYAGPSNHFWKCLNLSGLTPEPMTANDDHKLLQFGIGFTNVVERTTKSSIDLGKYEIKKGCEVLLKKLQTFRPKIAVFNGKLIYEIFGNKKHFNFGLQPNYIDGTNTYIWVMPSSSARYAHLPSSNDKLPFYVALKRFRDYLKGEVLQLNKEELIFPSKLNRFGITDVTIDEPHVKSEYFNNQDYDNCKGLAGKIVNTEKRKGFEREDIEANLKVIQSICNRTK